MLTERGAGLVLLCFAMTSIGQTRGIVGDEEFLYFAYGSNMLQERLQLLNPSAMRVSVGCLKGYKLAFGKWNKRENRWGGGVATILPSPDDEVWGVVWCLKSNDRQSLDDQEGVQNGIYSPIEVKVQQQDTEEELTCLSYQMNNFNSSLTSPLYKKVIIKGARENGLSTEYLKKLDTIFTNNYNETTPFTTQIIEILHQDTNNT
ncbi:gamma-glutamylcyclotransferase-like isoform X1 [Hemitrygon akajei]|uniref:gamma-glutamylcyclotransferase-like isoform X1 n=1 Tax=Hemitrygon akajei TaxID=2704970 RepID=UPI003BFA09A6